MTVKLNASVPIGPFASWHTTATRYSPGAAIGTVNVPFGGVNGSPPVVSMGGIGGGLGCSTSVIAA